MTKYAQNDVELAATRASLEMANNAVKYLSASRDELLEALEALLNQFNDRGYYANTHANVMTAMKNARAAIAKAKGE